MSPKTKNTHLGEIETRIKKVSKTINKKIKSKNKGVNLICDHLKFYQGKMLRPRLCLISEKIFSKNNSDDVIKTASSIEMIHMATLVHDDILDKSEKRRGAKTLFFTFGSEKSVMFGDWLLSNAYHLCSTIKNPKLNTRLGEVTNSLCEGQILQIHSRNEGEITRADYMNCISMKTASLVSASCELGSLVAGASVQNQKNIGLFAHHLGMAFQIVDDILDFTGDTSVLGKQTGTDLVQGEWTLPLIVFHEKTGVSKEEARVLFQKSPKNLLKEMGTCGVFDVCYKQANDEIHSSNRFLEKLPQSTWVDYLKNISKGILKRRF